MKKILILSILLFFCCKSPEVKNIKCEVMSKAIVWNSIILKDTNNNECYIIYNYKLYSEAKVGDIVDFWLEEVNIRPDFRIDSKKYDIHSYKIIKGK